jgi:hypothetical protein
VEYAKFEREFIERTLKVIEQYDQFVIPNVPPDKQYEVTLLINCLLGLLLLPHQLLSTQIPVVSLEDLTADWGLQPRFVRNWGRDTTHDLPSFVRRLRNGAAHTKLRSTGGGTDITELVFEDRNGFKAIIPVSNLKTFIKKLAATVKP